MVAVLNWVTKFWLKLYLAFFTIAGLGIAVAHYEQNEPAHKPASYVALSAEFIDYPMDGFNAPYVEPSFPQELSEATAASFFGLKDTQIIEAPVYGSNGLLYWASYDPSDSLAPKRRPLAPSKRANPFVTQKLEHLGPTNVDGGRVRLVGINGGTFITLPYARIVLEEDEVHEVYKDTLRISDGRTLPIQYLILIDNKPVSLAFRLPNGRVSVDPDDYVLTSSQTWVPSLEAAERLVTNAFAATDNAQTQAEALLGFVSYHALDESSFSLEQAEALLTKAAELGHKPSQEWLAFAYDVGDVFAQDKAKSRYWAKRAQAPEVMDEHDPYLVAF